MRISDWSSDVCSSDLGFARLQRFAKDIAQRRARIGRTTLLHRLLLLGDLHRLDREGRLLRPVEARHHRVELLADLEAFRTLLVAVAAEIGALDEAGRAVLARLHRSDEHTSELPSLMR